MFKCSTESWANQTSILAPMSERFAHLACPIKSSVYSNQEVSMGVELNTILKVFFFVNTMIKDLPPLLNIICSLSMARTIFKQLSEIFFLIYNLEICRQKE